MWTTSAETSTSRDRPVMGLEEELHTIWKESDRAAAQRAEDRERRFRRLQDLFTVRGNTPREHLRRLADIFSVQPGFFERFLHAVRGETPALEGLGGVFTPWGRIYLDFNGHLELASAELDCPYLLALVVDRQREIVKEAVAKLANSGVATFLANDNFDGVLGRTLSTWGSHENYLLRRPPDFAAEILPFLASRFYAGSGGVLWPHGEYLALTRALFLELDAGGGTTGRRAIHSTARNESLSSDDLRFSRYHLILADGHRSQFNLALQFGATALVLDLIQAARSPARSLCRELHLPQTSTWLETLNRWNVLAEPGAAPRVAPPAIDVQRRYLDACRLHAAEKEQPLWAPRLLADWEDTLDAASREDQNWLRGRLDAFAKYALFDAYLGGDWKKLDRAGTHEQLTLLSQSYHEFANEQSVFLGLEKAGALDHRITLDEPELGIEDETGDLRTATRARPRARFIREHPGEERYTVSWMSVFDRRLDRRASLADPLARELGPWEPARTPAV